MAARSTFIAIPDDVSNPDVLKRFLDKLIEQLDVAFHNRGTDGFVSEDTLLSETASLAQVIDRLNTLSSTYVTRKDGEFEDPAKYVKSFNKFRSNELITKRFLLAESTKNPKQPAISDLPSSASTTTIVSKVNEILSALRLANIIS